MKKENKHSQDDPLQQLRQGWQELTNLVESKPRLTDEELRELYDKICQEHGESGPEPSVWQRVSTVLMVLVALVAAVQCAWGCVRMREDTILCVLLGVTTLVCLLCAVWTVWPYRSPLYGRYWCEHALDYRCRAGLHVGYAVRNLLPLCATALVILYMSTGLIVGDGYNITTTASVRGMVVGNITLMISYLA